MDVWQTELQDQRLGQLQAISEDELQALIAEMNTAQRLPRLGLHFRKHGQEFVVETAEEYEVRKMVAWAIADVIDYYEDRLEALEDKAYSDFWADEVLFLLNARDELNDRWKELFQCPNESEYIF